MQRIRATSTLTQGFHKNPKINNHTIYAGDLEQTHVGSEIVHLVSVSPYEPKLIYSVDRVLLGVHDLFDTFYLSPPSSVVFL